MLAAGGIGLAAVGVLLWRTALASDDWPPVSMPVVKVAAVEMDSKSFSGRVLEKSIGLPVRMENSRTMDVPVDSIAAQPKEASPARNRADVVEEGTGAPVRLMISSIGVDAPIERVALTPAGSMDVPKHPLDVGWYMLGPRPGEIGSATLAGHVDWFGGATAVFANLHKVKPGDTITVQDDRGETVSFVVREIREYAAAAAATDVFISSDGQAHLNLITCFGQWDTQARQYSHRLVVFTDKKID
jgi:sortase (surface protein transpeptidase)